MLGAVGFKTVFLGLSLIFFTALFLPAVSEGWISVESLALRDSIESSLPTNAKWSLSIRDVDTGKIVGLGNADKEPLLPASLVKMLTSAAILDLDSREQINLKTVISYDGHIIDGRLIGNLYLKGTGNAFLSRQELENAQAAIVSKGIREIKGDIVADDSLFLPGERGFGYRGPAYAPSASLGLELHTVAITISGRPPKVKVEPVNEAVRVLFKKGKTPGIRQVEDLTYEASLPESKSGLMRKRFPLKDPALYAAGTLKTLLSLSGINVSGAVRKGRTVAEASELVQIPSRPLAEIVTDTNRNSINVSADNLFLLLGAKYFGEPGTTDKGAQAVYAFLDKLGIEHKGVKLADGSGLSSDNVITTAQLAEFLCRITAEPWFERFYDSLPRVGIDGTLKGFDSKLGYVKAKTGILKDAYCVAGYIERDGKGKVAFVYILNVPGAELSGNKIAALLFERLPELTL